MKDDRGVVSPTKRQINAPPLSKSHTTIKAPTSQTGNGLTTPTPPKTPPRSFNHRTIAHLRRSHHHGEGEPNSDSEVIPGLTRSRFLDNVILRVPVLVQRLELEVKMTEMMFKLPAFCLNFICFLAALCLLFPTHQIAQVNGRIIEHFGLVDSTLDEVIDVPSLYLFIETFELRNEELMATSWMYWCEQRYFNTGFDAELGIPTRACPSPRYRALGHISTDESSWTTVGAVPSPTPSSTNPCTDDDASVSQLNPAYTSCAAQAAEICSQDFGIQYCKLTCGYCSDWTYMRKKPFAMMQLAMLPSVVFQRRYDMKSCDGFGATYEALGHNTELDAIPALDGARGSALLSCVDRTSEYDAPYAHEVPCPDGVSAECPNGHIDFTQKKTFLGHSIYPRMLLEPHADILKMQAIEWIDVQTAQVEISTLVYTAPPLDIFTSVSVVFKIDDTGAIISSRAIKSYKDLTVNHLTVFCLMMGLAVVFCASGVYKSAHRLSSRRNTLKRTTWWAVVYEILCKGLMCVYFILLIYTSITGDRMQTEFEALISTVEAVRVSAVDSSIESAFDGVLTKFFDTMGSVDHKTVALKAHRVVSFVMIYMQFILLMLYFAAHPRIGVITSTIAKAYDHLFHFMVVLLQSFGSLGLIAYFMFAPDLQLFMSAKNTFLSQCKLLFGQWVQEQEGATMSSDALDTVRFSFYWLYVMTFMFLVFFMLLNLFLAIIVNAFFEVKKDEAANETENNFLVDILDVFSTRAVYRYAKWHSHSIILKQLYSRTQKSMKTDADGATFDDVIEATTGAENVNDDKTTNCPGQDFLVEFPGVMDDSDQLVAFLAYYYNKTPAILQVKLDGSNHLARGPSSPEKQLKKMENKVLSAKRSAELRETELAARVEQERQAISKVWKRVAQEREAFARFLSQATQEGHLHDVGSNRKAKRTKKTKPIAIGLDLDDEWNAAIQPREAH